MMPSHLCLSLLLLCTLSGCGTTLGPIADAAGLRKLVELPEAQKPPRTVAIRLHAADKLNVDAEGRPLALVARIYKLRQSAAFEQAPYATFLNSAVEKEALGADLVEVKEITLVPGQRHEVNEKVTREAGYIGVVALFHKPAPGRWRAAFAAAEAEQAGLTVGVHACALSVGAGAKPLGQEMKMLSSVPCQ